MKDGLRRTVGVYMGCRHLPYHTPPSVYQGYQFMRGPCPGASASSQDQQASRSFGQEPGIAKSELARAGPESGGAETQQVALMLSQQLM